jgi:hypothetical protein
MFSASRSEDRYLESAGVVKQEPWIVVRQELEAILMDENRKNAYRYLLYWAMLDIRRLAWMQWVPGWRTLSPFYWRQRFRGIQYAGCLADWLHNLALFSSLDFERFDEQRFWQDFEFLVTKRISSAEPNHFREVFERRLKKLETSKE